MEEEKSYKNNKISMNENLEENNNNQQEEKKVKES